MLACPQKVRVLPQPQSFFLNPDQLCLQQEPSQGLGCLHITTYNTEDMKAQRYYNTQGENAVLATMLQKQTQVGSHTLSLKLLHPFLSSIEGVL